MAKKDDFFDDIDAEIDLGEEDVDLDGHSDVNEDDLLMELDEMINQWIRSCHLLMWQLEQFVSKKKCYH